MPSGYQGIFCWDCGPSCSLQNHLKKMRLLLKVICPNWCVQLVFLFCSACFTTTMKSWFLFNMFELRTIYSTWTHEKLGLIQRNPFTCPPWSIHRFLSPGKSVAIHVEAWKWWMWWAGPPPLIPWPWPRTNAPRSASQDSPLCSPRWPRPMPTMKPVERKNKLVKMKDSTIFFRWWYGNSTNFIGKCWQTIKFWGTLLTPTLGQTHRCVECGGKTSKYDGWWYFNEYVSNYAIMPWPFSRVATHFSTKLCHM